MGEEMHLPLFETTKAKGQVLYRFSALSIGIGICLIWVYRATHIPKAGEDGRLGWMFMFAAELWFSLYWSITQALRWTRTYRRTFKDRLFERYENELPAVDVFVCTADPMIEPPCMVVNTVLSVMAYDYPPEKLTVYLSDDGGSEFTYYAFLEAAEFAKHWIPYCKKHRVEPRSPAAYFASTTSDEVGDQISLNGKLAGDFALIKKLYEEMAGNIENAVKLGRIPAEARSKRQGFSQWDSFSSKRDHDTILQIVIDGKDPNARDIEGCVLPTLVYLAREKRPNIHHNFKAGAMNALIRVSSNISNGKVILNVDCDMYSNNSKTIRDALCFLMDEEQGHEIAYVQFPQNFYNLTKNELYSSLLVISEVDAHGVDTYRGTVYIGTGCFHRRETICGKIFSKVNKIEMKWEDNKNREGINVHELEQNSKRLASCTFEENTLWGKQMGLKYGCAVEDVITGLSIHCRGWKSVNYNPTRKAFLGIAPTTLLQTLTMHQRWGEGNLQITFSKSNPVWCGFRKLSLGHQMGYLRFNLWALNGWPTLIYSTLPSLYLLRGTPLFPQITSRWIIPFTYVIIAKHIGSFAEYRWCGGTTLGWWNDQRIWLYQRTSSFLFAFINTLLTVLGFSNAAFVITAKVADEDVSKRYEEEVMEFGSSSPMFTVLATLAVLNLYCFAWVVKMGITSGTEGLFRMWLQIVLCVAYVVINVPLYEALCIRKDKGKLPSRVALKSMAFAGFACLCFKILY